MIRKLPLFRGLASKLGSLLLLFQRSPLVQMLFPEARLLGGAGMGEAVKWSVKAVVGLGAFDSVAGATEIVQVAPQPGDGEVSAWTGGFFNFVVQVAGTPSVDQVSWSVEGLPPGLTNRDTAAPSIHVISGTPIEAGETTVVVTAWEGPNQTGSSFSQEFLFIVAPGIITAHPASVAIDSGTSTTLSVAADPNGASPTYQWYRGVSGNTSNPIAGADGSGAIHQTIHHTVANTPAPYWVRVTRDGITQNSNTATVTVNTVTPPEPEGAGPFKVGESVSIDLGSLTNTGETLKLVGKLPKGLKLDLKTGQITGTVTGLAGTYPIKLNVLQGTALRRTVDFPIVIAGSVFFTGKYEALLESNDAIPAGAFKLLFKKRNAWSATLQSPGAKIRKAAGTLTLSPGSTVGTLTASFAGQGSAPAVTLNAILDLESPMVSGTYNGGTVRGFRLAEGGELPAASTTLSFVFEAGVHDGLTVPAGLGWANGLIGTSGTATFSGLLGDATAVKLPIHLSATGQSIVWLQPYANTSSYFGGILTLPDLGQTPADAAPLPDKFWWFKGPDSKSLSYPAGFPAMEVAVGSSKWTVPATASALGASLGWLDQSSPVVEIDGAGLSNATPQLTQPTLPTGFTLDPSFNLTAPASPLVVPWTGKTSATNGTFSGSLTLPAGFLPDGVAGSAAASGVLLQADHWGSVTGCGLIKVPVAGAKGSYRTAAIILKQ